MTLDVRAFAIQTARETFRPPLAIQTPMPNRKDCCADFAYVIACDGETDSWICPFCGEQWSAPCR